MNLSDELPVPRKARVEIIPLIDVVFFLLATFVLFTLSLQRIGVLDVPMPVPGPPGEDNTLHIQTSETGTLYVRVGGATAPEPIATLELRGRLESYRGSTATPRVFVHSDTKAKFGDAVLVLDEVRRAGIGMVSVETMTTPTGR